jgi:hypothetical protein
LTSSGRKVVVMNWVLAASACLLIISENYSHGYATIMEEMQRFTSKIYQNPTFGLMKCSFVPFNLSDHPRTVILSKSSTNMSNGSNFTTLSWFINSSYYPSLVHQIREPLQGSLSSPAWHETQWHICLHRCHMRMSWSLTSPHCAMLKEPRSEKMQELGKAANILDHP